MKNIILMIEQEPEEFNTLEELKERFIPNWKDLSQEEIEKILYEKSFGISRFEKLQIIHKQKGVYGSNYQLSEESINAEQAIIIDSIETYLLSLCKYNLITIFEEKNNRVFTNGIDIEIMEDGNYIIVNAYADRILKTMVGDNHDA